MLNNLQQFIKECNINFNYTIKSQILFFLVFIRVITFLKLITVFCLIYIT